MDPAFLGNTHKEHIHDYLVEDGEVTRVGYYTLTKVLGRGKYGLVRLGIHDFTGEAVAVKVIAKSLLSQEEASLLYRELRIHGLLQHKHIMRLYDVVDAGSVLCLLLEYCPGGELYDKIASSSSSSKSSKPSKPSSSSSSSSSSTSSPPYTPLPLPTTQTLFRQIVSALRYLHTLGIVHRDIKLANIQLDAEGNVKMGDFGFSRFFDPTPSSPRLLRSCGSPRYVAPEIVQHRPYTGPEVDLFSLGVTLYALVTGSFPMASVGYGRGKKERTERVRRSLRAVIDPHPALTALPEVADLIARMITKPSERISLSELASHPWIDLPPLRAPRLYGDVDFGNLDETVLDALFQMGWDMDELRNRITLESKNRYIPSYNEFILDDQAHHASTSDAVSAAETRSSRAWGFPSITLPMLRAYSMLVQKKAISTSYRDAGAPLLLVDNPLQSLSPPPVSSSLHQALSTTSGSAGGDERDRDGDEDAMLSKFNNDFFSIYTEVGADAPRPNSPIPEKKSPRNASAPAPTSRSRSSSRPSSKPLPRYAAPTTSSANARSRSRSNSQTRSRSTSRENGPRGPRSRSRSLSRGSAGPPGSTGVRKGVRNEPRKPVPASSGTAATRRRKRAQSARQLRP